MNFALPLFITWIFIHGLSLTSLGQQQRFITGKIYNKANKEVLTTAKLVLYQENKYISKATTDHQGNYWFAYLEPGIYHLHVKHAGHSDLEVLHIDLTATNTIQLDLGLMESSLHNNVGLDDKVSIIYEAPIVADLVHQEVPLQQFSSQIRILDEVYEGHQIRIAPPHVDPPLPRHRATHFSESLEALTKKRP